MLKHVLFSLQLFFHKSDFESLYKAISPDLMPERLNGNIKEEEFSDTSIVKSVFAKEEMCQRSN